MGSRLAGFGLCLILIYFAYHALAGEQGLGRWSDMQEETAHLQAELDAIEAEIAILESDILKLTPGSIDRDYVEGLARERLAFAYPDEIILTH